jgi:ferrous iron transport protein B
MEERHLRVVLSGNPNCGKTTIFNHLTGSRQRTGNYPGITVEKREGLAFFGTRRVDVLDLPGTYGLFPFSPEERIAERVVLHEPCDVVVVVVDSTTLRRSLVMLAQVMHTGARVVLCLNMADEAARSGQRIDIVSLSERLGCPVVETVGSAGRGLVELREAILRVAGCPSRQRLVLGARMDAALAPLRQKLVQAGVGEAGCGWWAMRALMEGASWERLGAEEFPAMEARARREIADEAERQRQRLIGETGVDVNLIIMQSYYGFVDGLLREVTRRPPQVDIRAVSDAVDSVLVHRVMGVPFFLLIMYGLFFLTFHLGEWPMHAIEWMFAWMSETVTRVWPVSWSPLARSALVDGVLAGVGGVIVFLPNIALLFFGLGVLEDTGYMARIAFLTDRVMHAFGLHGKSFVPMVTGFGCSVPAIMATRTLENERDRLTTMLVLPLVPCGARLTIWLLLVPAFFPIVWQPTVLMGIYLFGVLMALLVAWLLRKTALAGDDAPFVMELPPYRAPTWRGLMVRMWDRCWSYLRKAGTLILGVSLLLWALTSFRLDFSGGAPLKPVEMGSSEALESSIAGEVGRMLEPVMSPLGFDWRINVALLGATAAKEVVVSQLALVFSMEDAGGAGGENALRESLARTYPISTAVALILFLLIALPCAATIAVTRRESGRWRWALFQLTGLTVIGYLVAWIGKVLVGAISGLS